MTYYDSLDKQEQKIAAFCMDTMVSYSGAQVISNPLLP